MLDARLYVNFHLLQIFVRPAVDSMMKPHVGEGGRCAVLCVCDFAELLFEFKSVVVFCFLSLFAFFVS